MYPGIVEEMDGWRPRGVASWGDRAQPTGKVEVKVSTWKMLVQQRLEVLDIAREPSETGKDETGCQQLDELAGEQNGLFCSSHGANQSRKKVEEEEGAMTI